MGYPGYVAVYCMWFANHVAKDRFAKDIAGDPTINLQD
jgi:hypothetical protein